MNRKELLSYEEMLQLVDTGTLLFEFFGDHEKVAQWLTTKNLLLGGVRPIDLFLLGRGHKVLKFVESAKDESGW